MLKLLLIEDDPVFANLVGRILELNGMDVCHVRDGKIGLQMVRELDPDAILVDMNLPDTDGKEIAFQLRKSARWEHTPIIALTGHAGDKVKRLAINFGCTDLISKPINPLTFPEQILKIIESVPQKRPIS